MKITGLSTTVTWGGRRNWVIVKLRTDTELIGWGGPVVNSAIAGLDQALWDLRGKAWGVPVYRLLGGPTREYIRLYTHVGIHEPDEMVQDAQRDVADGFTAMKTGGISEVKKIAALAEAYYVQLAPHNPQGPLSTAAAAHLGMAIPNFLILEFVRQDSYRDTALRDAWTIEAGNLLVPDTPGLGVDLDEDALLASPYRPRQRGDGPLRADGSVADP